MIINLNDVRLTDADVAKYMVVWVVSIRKYTVSQLRVLIGDYITYFNFKHAFTTLYPIQTNTEV